MHLARTNNTFSNRSSLLALQRRKHEYLLKTDMTNEIPAFGAFYVFPKYSKYVDKKIRLYHRAGTNVYHIDMNVHRNFSWIWKKESQNIYFVFCEEFRFSRDLRNTQRVSFK